MFQGFNLHPVIDNDGCKIEPAQTLQVRVGVDK